MAFRTIRVAPILALPLVLGMIAAASGLASCGGSTNATTDTTDAAIASDASSAPVDAAPDATTDAAVSSCDLGATPTMPTLSSEFVIEGTDGGTLPTPTGGDETGTWVYTKITLYLPSQASGQVDPAASTIEGKGFMALESGSFRNLVDTTTKLKTTVVGTVTRATSAKALGTYVKDGPSLTFTASCRDRTDTSPLKNVRFSRVDATHGQLFVQTTTQIGTADLVVDVEKAP
jgi:hypothetical protein